MTSEEGRGTPAPIESLIHELCWDLCVPEIQAQDRQGSNDHYSQRFDLKKAIAEKKRIIQMVGYLTCGRTSFQIFRLGAS